MDEVEYRLRDLDVIADHAGGLPAAAELRRRGERRRTRHRIGIAAATFAVVALVAGGATALLNNRGEELAGTPSGGASATVDPVPTESSSTTPEDTPSTTSGKPPAAAPKTDVLSPESNENYWIWAPSVADGKQMLDYDYESGMFDLSRKTKKLDPDGGPNWRGEMLLLPVPGNSSVWEISYPPSNEADTICFVTGEADIVTEICDEADEKQHWVMTLQDDGETYSIQSAERQQYLVPGADRTVEWSDSAEGAGVWSFEARNQE